MVTSAGLMDTVGLGITLTVVTALVVQLPVPDVTVYVVVVPGVAVTMLPVELLNEPAGLQLYAAEPLTVNVLEAPIQIPDEGDTTNVGVTHDEKD